MQTETFVEKKVNYYLEVKGQLIVIKNVPALVSVDSGEQLFSPETVENLKSLFMDRKRPSGVIPAAVFEFAC